jgi:hypothetical protein
MEGPVLAEQDGMPADAGLQGGAVRARMAGQLLDEFVGADVPGP